MGRGQRLARHGCAWASGREAARAVSLALDSQRGAVEVYEQGLLGSGRGSRQGGEEEPQPGCIWGLSEFRMACFQALRSTARV